MRSISEEVARALRGAEKLPLLPLEQLEGEVILDRAAIESLIPHRDPFLLLDSVQALDEEGGLIAARYNLARAADVLAGHFPGHPAWPGVLQVEAIGQAGCVLVAHREALGEGEVAGQIAATHILGARFVSPVAPQGDVSIVARVLEDGLFWTVVGQCFQNRKLCCVAAVCALA